MDDKKRRRFPTGNPISVLITLLILANIVLGFLLYREHLYARRIYRQLTALDKNFEALDSYLARKDCENGQLLLAKIQGDLTGLLSRPSIFEKLRAGKQPAKVKSASKSPRPPDFRPDTRRIPASFILAPEGTYLLFCEKKNRTLSLYKSASQTFSLVKTYQAVIGKNNHDKSKAGDLATPEGAYFITRFIPDKDLPEQYGGGAFTLSYPNFWDVKNGRSGQGIWVHGHNPVKTFAEIENTRGCIVVSNEDLNEIAEFIKPGTTPIAIVDEITYLDPVCQKELAGQLSAFLDSWKKAWESLDNQKYFAFYSPAEFANKDGMDFAKFKKFKERVNAGKKFVKLNLANTVILTFQKAGQEIAFVQFDQEYKSNNLNAAGRKTLYLKKFQQKWLIIGEI